MFTAKTIPYKTSGVLNSLVRGYMNKNETLKSFYAFFPDKNGFNELLNSKPYANFNRQALSDILLKQSEAVKNTSENSLQNIELLKKENTFTVTTGHQLCLFTGPLYFIYKIISTINLAEALKKEFPAYDFVPVYWAASEDHDFEEINHFNVFGKKLEWKSEQGGAVGNFKTKELEVLLPALEKALGKSENSGYLISLFKTAYLQHQNLADATRFMVNELFGNYGLVTIDGDDKNFKTQFKHILKKDIFENSPFALVNSSIKELEKLNYHAQVKPREINCFYLNENARLRIEKVGEQFNLLGTDTFFSKQELENIIETTPEKISPNVVLRPVYQQSILPNMAYIGGPGELAYWLEFKKMFDEHNIFFPVLMPRNFVMLVDKFTKNKMAKLKFSETDFFKSEIDLIKEFQVKTNSLFDVNAEKEKISELYTALRKKTNSIDVTLDKHVLAQLQKQLKTLENIAAKANRASKKKFETEISNIRAIKSALFPNNVPQERHENFSSFYLSYGKHFIETLKEKLNPFVQEQFLLVED